MRDTLKFSAFILLHFFLAACNTNTLSLSALSGEEGNTLTGDSETEKTLTHTEDTNNNTGLKISTIADQHGRTATNLKINVTNHTDASDMVYSSTGLPPGISLDGTSGVFSGKVIDGLFGTYQVTVFVYAGDYAADVQFSWVVPETDQATAPSKVTENDQGAVDVVTTGNDQGAVDVVTTGNDRLLLHDDVLTRILQQKRNDPEMFDYFIKRLEYYINTTPYDKSLYTMSYALGYIMTGNVKYLKKSEELLVLGFFNEEKPFDYDRADTYRQYFQFMVYTCNWLAKDMSASLKLKCDTSIEAITQHWITKIGFEINDNTPEFVGEYMRISDSDRTIAYGYNLLLGGIYLENNKVGQTAIQAAEYTYNDFVIPHFIEGIMAGQFTEGTGYGPNTMTFITKYFLLNAQERGKTLDTSYFDDLTKTLLHETLPAFNTIYIHGDVETDWNIEYPKPFSSPRMLDYAHHLYPVVNQENKALIKYWKEKALAQYESYPIEGDYSGLWALIFETEEVVAKTPNELNVPTEMHATGRNFISMRTSWEEDASVLYFSNSRSSVDHQHFDQLSFEIAKGDTWLTHEISGYDLNAWSSQMHNTLLVEGAYSGYLEGSPRSSKGDGSIVTLDVTSEYGYINAEAKDIYNMFQWKESNHVKAMNRKLFFMKPNIVIVYDHVETDKTELWDFSKVSKAGFNGVTEYTRWVKYMQHFEVEPVMISDYQYLANDTARGYSIALETLLPKTPKVKVVDELEYFKGIYDDGGNLITAELKQYNAPDSQRKWHITVQPEKQTQDTDFMTVLAFDENKNFQIPHSKLVQAIDDQGNDIDGSIVGVQLTNADAQKVAVIYNRNPLDTHTESGYIRFVVDTDVRKVYMLGFKGETSYRVVKQRHAKGTQYAVIPRADQQYIANSNGILIID